MPPSKGQHSDAFAAILQNADDLGGSSATPPAFALPATPGSTGEQTHLLSGSAMPADFMTHHPASSEVDLPHQQQSVSGQDVGF